MGLVTDESPPAAWPTWWVVRGVVAVHLLVVAAQPVLAGRFMAGDYDMLKVHGVTGSVVAVTGMVQAAAAVLAWRLGGGPVWAVWATVGIGAADSLQTYLGYRREIGIHIPLGVSIAVASVLLATAVWRHAPTRETV